MSDRSKQENSQRCVLITGATDGIGQKLAALYASEGDRVVLLGRRPVSELSEPLPDGSAYCRADLARDDCVQRVLSFLDSQGVHEIDVVVHNAATGYFGSLEGQPESSIDETLKVNLTAPILLTRGLISRITKNRGQLVFISSVVSALPCPEYAVYAASKSALDGFVRSLRSELEGSLKVQVIYPGATRTAFHAKLGIPRGRLDPRGFASPESMAREIHKAVRLGHREATIGLSNRLLRFAGIWARPLVDYVVRSRAAGGQGQ